MGGFHGLSMKKIQSKYNKKPASSSLVFFLQRVLSLLSLSIVAFGHHHYHYRLDHQPLYHKKPSDHLTWWLHQLSLSSTNSSSSSSTNDYDWSPPQPPPDVVLHGQTTTAPGSFLLLLLLLLFFFFFFFFTVSIHKVKVDMNYNSRPIVQALTVGVNYNSRPLFMQWMLVWASSSPSHLYGLDSAQPQRRRKKDMLARDQPNRFGPRSTQPNIPRLDPTHIYLIYVIIFQKTKKIIKNKKSLKKL